MKRSTMAMVFNVAMVYNMATMKVGFPCMHAPPSSKNNAAPTEHLAALLRADGWMVDLEPSDERFRPDLMASKGSLRYAVELKCVAEGRPDRVLSMLSQAILQAGRHAEPWAMRPLAVVQVGYASPSLRRKVEQFHRDYAPDVAIGLVSETGGSRFIGPGLEALNVEAPRSSNRGKLARPRNASDLFSDLNQWMLKVLLAPELPENLLNAPRGEYASGSELADAAQVSAMSASRFVRRLQEEGFLEDSGPSLRLVRRRELFRRWQFAAMRSSPELRMSYLIPAAGARQLHKVVARLDACIGLFAAADLLKLGHVSGVAPHVYVRRLSAPPSDAGWPGLVPTGPGEPAQIVLKQASAPESLFRGAVRVDGVLVSDVLQIWLDASGNSARGAEQAEFLAHKVLSHVMGEQQ